VRWCAREASCTCLLQTKGGLSTTRVGQPHMPRYFFLPVTTMPSVANIVRMLHMVTMRMDWMTAAHDTQLAAKVVLAWSC
jgi:hypothetical protein